jgi:hypothetical protein
MKTIETQDCGFCESNYKLSFSPDNVSGFSKFCPFCGNEIYADNDSSDENDADD